MSSDLHASCSCLALINDDYKKYNLSELSELLLWEVNLTSDACLQGSVLQHYIYINLTVLNAITTLQRSDAEFNDWLELKRILLLYNRLNITTIVEKLSFDRHVDNDNSMIYCEIARERTS